MNVVRNRNFAVAFLFSAVFGFAGTTVATASGYSSAVMAQNPLSYWQFTEANGVTGTAIAASTVSADTGSLGNNGTYQNGSSTMGSKIPTALFPGMSGSTQSVNFSAQNSIQGSASGLPTGSLDRTWTGWVNFAEAGNGTYHDVFSYGSPGGGSMIFTLVPPHNTDTNLNGTGLAFPFGIPGNFGVSQYGDGIGTLTPLNTSTWHFLAWTESAGNYKLYVDGALAASKAMATNTATGSNYWIGDDSLANDFYLGQLAQEAIFGTVLSQSQILGLYTAALVPEPASIVLFGLGAIGLFVAARRRRAA